MPEEPEDPFAVLDAAFGEFLASMEGYYVTKPDSINELLVEDPPYLLDVRKLEETEAAGYIPGTGTIPLLELGENFFYLPEQDVQVVSYCGSGWRCTIALTGLGALGWDVVGLKGDSFAGWVAAGYATEEGLPPAPEAMNTVELDEGLASLVADMFSNVPDGYGVLKAEALNTELVENPDLVVIDVRRDEEDEGKGYIGSDNFIHIPLEQFITHKDEWPTDLSTPIAVYWGSGHRSIMAMTILWTYGYTDVSSLKGGFSGWLAAGYPYEGGESALDEAFGDFLARMEGYYVNGLDTLNEMLVEDLPFLLDVRKNEETEAAGYILGTVTIPLQKLGENLAYLPEQDVSVVSYCGSGWRCTIALTGLGALGWDVGGLKGGSFGGWLEAGYATEEGLPLAPEAMNTVELDEELVTAVSTMFGNVPDGYGVMTAETLNTELVENPDLIVIDVRREDEVYSKGYIESPNYIHIPLEQFLAKKSMWPSDRDAPVAIYCGSGHRSTMAMAILWTYGYSDVHSLKGGFSGWVSEGYPFISGEVASLDAAYGDFLARMEGYYVIGLDGLNELMIEEPPYLLDVRNLDETAAVDQYPVP